LNLDIRDLDVWLRAAEREEILDKIHDLRMSRMQWAEVDAVRSDMAFYQSMLRRVEGNGASAPTVKKWTELTGGKRKG